MLIAVALFTLTSLQSSPLPPPEQALSAAEVAAIEHRIATLRSPADRGLAQNWSNAKKVAELLCRPQALPVLKERLTGVDRVFLGTDDPQSLTLVSSSKLLGVGSARTPQGWQDFKFTCELDPATAKVTRFEPATDLK